MKYEIRTLKTKDIFPMSKILTKIGVNKIKDAFNSENVAGGKDVTTIGLLVTIDLAGIILSNLPSCETEIFNFLSDLTGATADELKEDSLSDFAELIVAIVEKQEFKDFFGAVSKLLK